MIHQLCSIHTRNTRDKSLLDRHYEYYILPASKEYLADIVLLIMYNVDNMDLLSITPLLHKALHFAESCQRIEIVLCNTRDTARCGSEG